MNIAVVLLALVAFTCLSWGLSYAHLGALAPVIALTIAALKAGLVITYFMELGRSGVVVKVAVTVTLLGIVLLCAGLVADVNLR